MAFVSRERREGPSRGATARQYPEHFRFVLYSIGAVMLLRGVLRPATGRYTVPLRAESAFATSIRARLLESGTCVDSRMGGYYAGRSGSDNGRLYGWISPVSSCVFSGGGRHPNTREHLQYTEVDRSWKCTIEQPIEMNPGQVGLD